MVKLAAILEQFKVGNDDRSVLSVMGKQPRIIHDPWSCEDHAIHSLKGCAEVIDGSFWCNYLTTLIGGPRVVRHNYYCYSNILATLEGAPESMQGDFLCYDNKLTSLAGAPKLMRMFSADNKLPLMKFLMTSTVKSFTDEMRCAEIVNPYLKGKPLTRSEMLQLQQELIDAGFEEEAQL